MNTKDLAEFVIKYRKGKAFFNQTFDEVLYEIYQAVSLNTCAYCVGADNKILGVVTGSVIPEDKVYYVMNIVTIRSGILNKLLDKFQSLYPNYNLEARRNGKIKRYNTPVLLQKINSMTQKGII